MGEGTSDLTRFLREHREEILGRWEQKARTLPHARFLSESELRDHLPPLLESVAELATTLDSATDAFGRPVPFARRHAHTRLSQGFPVEEVIREYAFLRDTIEALWQEAPDEPTTALEGLRTLNCVLDAAVESSIRQYVEERDRTLESLDSIAAAALQSHSLDQLLSRLLEELLEAMPSAETAAIFVREGERLRLRATAGLARGGDGVFELRIGEGFAGTVARERRAVALRDARSDPLVARPALREANIRALLGIPLIEGGELIGVADIGSTRMHAFTPRERHLLRTVAARAAMAMNQIMLREAADRRARQQRAVADLGVRSLRPSQLPAVVADAARTTVEALGVDAVSIWRLEPDGELSLAGSAGLEASGRAGGRPRADRGAPMGFALVTERPVIVEQLEHDRRFEPDPYLVELGVVSASCVSIPSAEGDAPFGILCAHTRTPRAFTRDDTAVLETVSNVIGAEVYRDRADAALRRAEESHRFLSEASRRLAETLDYEATLEKLARLATYHIADWCIVDVWDTEKQTGRRVAVEHQDARLRGLAIGARRGRTPEEQTHEGALRVMRTGEAELVSVVTETTLRGLAGDDEHFAMLQRLSVHSYLCVPIRRADQVLGALTLISTGAERRFRELDLLLARELAHRAALALENARLYRVAQNAARRRDQLLGIVSHDLRGPLSTIAMTAEVLSENATDLDVDQTVAHSDRIRRAARRMERLIQDLLDVASLEQGLLDVVLHEEDPASISNEALEAARPGAEKAGIALHASAPAGLPRVHVDRDRLLQVLGNLVNNALRFTPPGGRIDIDLDLASDGILFSVRDTGPGVAPEALDHVFELYWRGDDSRGGTGRGLAISKAIVEAHGGRIWVESEPGKGAVFRFRLPLRHRGGAGDGARSAA